MKVYFITENEHPGTNAASHRLSLLIKAVEHQNIKTDVFVVGFFTRLPFIVGFVVSFFIKFYMSFSLCAKVKRNDIAFFYGCFPFPWTPMILRMKGVRIFHERTEFPYYLIMKNKKLLNFIRENLSILSMSFSNGIVTCSHTLSRYYTNRTGIKKTLVIPLIVEEAVNEIFYPKRKKEVTYCGYMGNNKDGVHNLILAFQKIRLECNDWKLRLIGGAGKSVMGSLRAKVIELGLEDAVVFTGQIEHKEVIKQLEESSILALARPGNKQSEGGFPSKLGEYLLTGLPIVVTSVGEIPDYICDGYNGYLAKPNDIDDFANKTISVIKNYEEAIKVGLRGKETVSKFGYKTQSRQIIDFIFDENER